MKTKLIVGLLAAVCAVGLGLSSTARANSVTYNTTQTAINGSGNTDNGWSVFSSSTLTLATMAQYNYPGYPNNATAPADPNNSAGTFLFPTGPKPGSSTRGQFDVWFSVGTIGSSLAGSGLDFYWSVTTTGSGTALGPINLKLYTDSSYGTSSTPNGDGTVGTYASESGVNTLMQNAQDPSWLISGYNPNLDQTLLVDLFAVAAGADPLSAAKVGEITSLIQVGNGGAVPDGGSTGILLGASFCGLLVMRKRKAIMTAGACVVAMLIGFAPQQARATPYNITFTGGGWSAVGQVYVTGGLATSGYLDVTYGATTIDYGYLATGSGIVKNNNGDQIPVMDNLINLTAADFVDQSGLLFVTTPINNGGQTTAFINLSADQNNGYVPNLSGWGNSPAGFGYGVPNVDGTTTISAVPDGGSTATLLGAGMFCLAAFKRKAVLSVFGIA
jgi:hypothetical protein